MARQHTLPARDTSDIDAVTTWFGDLDPPTLRHLVA